MDVSENSGTPKSSILIGFSIINHPFWAPTPIFGNTDIVPYRLVHEKDGSFFVTNPSSPPTSLGVWGLGPPKAAKKTSKRSDTKAAKALVKARHLSVGRWWKKRGHLNNEKYPGCLGYIGIAIIINDYKDPY